MAEVTVDRPPECAASRIEAGYCAIRAGRYDAAVDAFSAALLDEPRNVDALRGRAQCLFACGRLEQAVAAYDVLLDVAPGLYYMEGERFHAQLHSCNWHDYEARREALVSAVRRGDRVDIPGAFLCYSDSPADQRRCAEIFAADMCAVDSTIARPRHAAGTGRIRLGYLSGDFHAHATAYLAAGLFERHDRARFELHAFSYGPNDGSIMRARLEHCFDRFSDVGNLSDDDIAAAIADCGIDIAIDMKGYTLGARPRILAMRPAPVQVAFLAFPGTMGAKFIDYLIADRCVIPDISRSEYTENIAYLPDSYQVNDAGRALAPRPPREQCALPASAFVFCCFNSLYKITPFVFDVWMRILAECPNSVLWLLQGPAVAMDKLRATAQARGIDVRRLVFAPWIASAHHWARVALADLMLDTFPVNAHTTASDALWQGVPLVTIAGCTFTSRVATSVLRSVGLGQLSVSSLQEYERLAVRLAHSPVELRQLRAQLQAAREHSSLFRPDQYARRLEAAFTEMHRRHLAGEPPRMLAITPVATLAPE